MIKQSSIYTLQRTCENEDNYRYCSHNILLSLASKVKLMQMLMTFLPSHVKKKTTRMQVYWRKQNSSQMIY